MFMFKKLEGRKRERDLILSSKSGRLWLLQTLSVLVNVSVCLSVCPAFTVYISVTVGRILMKLGGNVGTEVSIDCIKSL